MTICSDRQNAKRQTDRRTEGETDGQPGDGKNAIRTARTEGQMDSGQLDMVDRWTTDISFFLNFP